MRGRVLGILAFMAVVIPPACGGAPDPKGILASSSGTASSTSSSGVGSSSGGGSGGSSGGSSGAGSGSGSSSSGGSSGALDAGVVDTGGPIDTGAPDLGPPETSTGDTIVCPPKSCTAPDVCCATGTGAGQAPTYRCQAQGHTCNGNTGPGTIISCSSTADCSNGDVCCGAVNNSVYEQVSCQPTCNGTAPDGATLVIFCDPAANDCPNGGQCQPSQILTGGFSVCN
jgi:hypothetical protein